VDVFLLLHVTIELFQCSNNIHMMSTTFNKVTGCLPVSIIWYRCEHNRRQNFKQFRCGQPQPQLQLQPRNHNHKKQNECCLQGAPYIPVFPCQICCCFCHYYDGSAQKENQHIIYFVLSHPSQNGQMTPSHHDILHKLSS
jgi:hypothetical protein